MKRMLIVFLSIVMSEFLCAGVIQYNSSDVSINGSWYNCNPGEEFSGNLGTLSSLVIGGKVNLQYSSTGANSILLCYEVAGNPQQNMSLEKQSSQRVNQEIWEENNPVSIDISGLTNGNSYEIRIHFVSDDGSAYLYDPAIMYYSAFFTKGPEAPAPVTLASFTAEVVKGKVELCWVTESETENSHFLVYRDDEVIGRVDGNGTTSEQHSYTFLDTQVSGGMHSYAIADVTYGGVEELHDAVTVEVGAEIAEADFVLNNAYPNPFNPRVTLRLEYGVGSNTVLSIYNTQGVLVDQLINGFVEAGHHDVVWDASNMTSGVYIVKAHAGDVMQSQKIVLMK